MIFSSLFFMLFFLPLFLLFYFSSNTIERKNRVLLIFSLIFYCWGGVRYIILLVLLSFVGWYSGIVMERTVKQETRKKYLIGSVIIFVGVLVFFKYTGFFLRTFGFNDPSSPLLKLALPVGISFYTFKLISYVMDVYRETVTAEPDYITFLTYVSMFHHCVAGPIVRYSTIQNELHSRKRLYADIANGIYRCCIGLFKKAVFANHCGTLAENFLPIAGDIASVPVSGVWLGSLCYMLQIYLDFSAYSDIAIGLGQICGFHFEENFNYPYIASSVKDFWKRWHISLSSFFRDYVYIPLGGNRVSPKRLVINLLVVWALTGFWHGASWNYVLWGLFFFVFIFLENKYIVKKVVTLPKAAMHAITLFIVFISWIIFRFENFASLGKALAGLFGLNSNSIGSSAVNITFANNIFFIIIAIVACTPVFRKIMTIIERKTTKPDSVSSVYYTLRIVISVVFFILSIIALIGNSYSPFLYYQF